MDYCIEKLPSKMTVGDSEGTCSLSLQLCVLQCLSTFTAGEDCGQPKQPRLETEPIPKAGGEWWRLFCYKDKAVLKQPKITLRPPSIHHLFQHLDLRSALGMPQCIVCLREYASRLKGHLLHQFYKLFPLKKTGTNFKLQFTSYNILLQERSKNALKKTD